MLRKYDMTILNVDYMPSSNISNNEKNVYVLQQTTSDTEMNMDIDTIYERYPSKCHEHGKCGRKKGWRETIVGK